MSKMKELIDELESLAEGFWLADEAEATGGIGALELYDFMDRFGHAVYDARTRAKVRYNAALEAYWTNEARDFAKTAPEGERAVRTIDENMAISRAAVGIDAKFGEFLRLLDVLAVEFIHLVSRLFQVRFETGYVSFESGDLVACKKQAEALKTFAGMIEKFEEGDYAIDDFHAASIAYSNALRIA